ncbi:MAG TPA: hypothetical protein VEV61_11455 [Streptosporangiaceae bacterium]|nr:hypothetical protein [Streptosporangiaceae bacterium]
MKPLRHISQMVGVCALIAVAATVTACGSSSGSGGSPTASPASPTTATTSPPSTGGTGSAADQATIKANWEAFFNNKTPVNKRIALLENGQQFASTIHAMAGSGLAALATAKVTQVTVNSPTRAAVKYDILVGGTPELKGQLGVAVKQGGTWKVGVKSFCGLLIIENAGKTSGLPSACKSA